MQINDRRERSHFDTHTSAVIMRDRFLGGWGKASGGTSCAAWVCLPEHSEAVRAWVESRSDAERVQECDLSQIHGRARKMRAAHLSIYVVGPNHPAIKVAA